MTFTHVIVSFFVRFFSHLLYVNDQMEVKINDQVVRVLPKMAYRGVGVVGSRHVNVIGMGVGRDITFRLDVVTIFAGTIFRVAHAMDRE